MNYKKYFWIVLIALILLIFAFIIVPLATGYQIGLINNCSVSLENIYFILSVLIAGVVAIFTYRIYSKQLKLMEEQKIISDSQTALSKKQTEILEQQNRIALFERRLKCYMILTGCISLYKETHSLLTMTKKDPVHSIKDDFVYLTNNSYLECITHVIVNPLNNDYKVTYLNKLEEMQTLATEIELIFDDRKSTIAKKFLIAYTELLRTMYKFETFYTMLENENKKQLMDTEDFQLRIKNNSGSKNLVDAITTLENSFEELKSNKVIEKFKRKLKL